MKNPEPALTLDELSLEVSRLLEEKALLEAQGDGRVAAAPDARTVRYYGTLGLVDRPSIVEREARYGRRHVLQLVAVKALQARGLPLAEIQARLYGRSNSELETLLSAVSQDQARPAGVRALRWREVTVEPGLKVMVEDGWAPRLSPAALEERIRAALAALSTPEGGSHGRP
ncbi:MAG TPA: MerR family transcriptional regulator [Candidatus Saccharimonadales bacterium]|nr:MerR family transcriptional regulator [Candidatus Saccharimonadales bacterium]